MVVRGFGNVGNTCGLNAVLQCIAHTPHLREFFLNAEAGKPADGAKYSIADELKRVLQEFWTNDKSLVPTRFVRAFEEASRGRLQMGEQLDITEVWLVLVDRLESEWQTTSKHVTAPWMSVQSRGVAPLVERANAAWSQFMARVPPSWASIVNGLQVGQVICSACNHVYHNFEPFTTLSLDIPVAEPGKSVHLSACFGTYFKQEHLEGDWKCDKCDKTSALKLARFWWAPQCLVVILKRFRYSPRLEKIHTPVDIPETFTLLEGTELSRMGTSELPTYRIQAIGCHFGTLGGGHYTALARDANKWHHYDDLNITELANSEQALKNNIHAYMLFYARD